MGYSRGGGGRPTLPEIGELRELRLLPDLASVVALPGGHHFGGAYRELAQWILRTTRTR